MTEQNQPVEEETVTPEADTVQPEPQEPPTYEELQARIAELEGQLKDSELRGLANEQNLRRRHQQEIADTHKFAGQKFAAEMLPVKDYLEMALLDQSGNFDALKMGVQMTLNELQKAFESTMKLFQQQQQQTVDSLKLQTERIGEDAANLSRALKGESKTQGDWGEMVLETLLENSGLQRDEEFFVQETVKSEDGASFRPDVVVKFPEGRSVVIDSKVSLKAYADAVAAEDERERDQLLAEHAKSVHRHVDELSAKSYDKLVKDAIGFVLMFVPNENSYIAAMKQQPDLSRYAYQKRIIIISPSNLLMALQLAYNLWQYDRQSKNVEKIVKTAADLYDKVAGFAETFTDLEAQLQRLARNFEQARGQLFDGKGNVLKRIEGLRALGVTPKKRIKGLEEE